MNYHAGRHSRPRFPTAVGTPPFRAPGSEPLPPPRPAAIRASRSGPGACSQVTHQANVLRWRASVLFWSEIYRTASPPPSRVLSGWTGRHRPSRESPYHGLGRERSKASPPSRSRTRPSRRGPRGRAGWIGCGRNTGRIRGFRGCDRPDPH